MLENKQPSRETPIDVLIQWHKAAGTLQMFLMWWMGSHYPAQSRDKQAYIREMAEKFAPKQQPQQDHPREREQERE